MLKDLFFANDKNDPQNAKDMTRKEIEQERLNSLLTKLDNDDLMVDVISDMSRDISNVVTWALGHTDVTINDEVYQVAGESIINEIIHSLEKATHT